VTRKRAVRAAGLAALVAVVAALAVAPVAHPWIINDSSSMPVGLYALDPVDRPIVRGDTVVVCAPPAIAALSAARGYLESGACSSNTAPLLKLVAAMAGDVVELRPRSIEIGGRCLGSSPTFEADRTGRPLPRIPRGRYRLRAGQLWLWAPAERSFDSRYFGPVDAGAVVHFARAMIVGGPAASLARSNGPCAG